MDKEEFYRSLAEILETPSVTDEFPLGKEALDSMQILSLISLIDERLGVQVAVRAIQEAPNAAALWRTVEETART